MRFLMLFLRLVLCAVCLFALCPSVPQADGSDTPDSLPLLAQERIQERDSCLLAAPGAAFSLSLIHIFQSRYSPSPCAERERPHNRPR